MIPNIAGSWCRTPGLAVAALLCWPILTGAADLIGRASVIDGDTIEIHGLRIRLHGIDAPESRQLCEADGKQYRCGQLAALALADKIADHTVNCRQTDTDRYGRAVAICWAGEMELNAEMVRAGFALAFRKYSMDYVDEESEAKAAARGLWSGQFQPPWEWRISQAPPPPDPACPIKGNIGSGGKRLYHIPGDGDYDRTKIDLSKGERWFCSEVEAEAAGWRRVGR